MFRLYLQKLGGVGIGTVLARGAGEAFAVNVLGMAVAFGVQILLARLLGVGSYGYYIYALTWVNLLVLLGKLGLDTATLRFVPEYYDQSDWTSLRGFLRHSHQLAFAASALTALAVAGVVWLLRGRLGPELAMTLWVACLLLPISVLLQVSGSGLQALKRIIPAQAPQAILRPLLVAGGVLLVFSALGQRINAPAAMAVNLGAALAAAVLTSWFLRRSLPPALYAVRARYAAREWVSVAFPLLLISGLNLVLSQTDTLMVGALLGTTEAGIYATASRAAGLILFGLTAVNTIAAPMISELYAQGRREELQRMLTLAARGILAFALPVGLVMIIWGQSVLALFGPAFTQGYWAFVILTLGMLVNSSVGSVGFLMTMTGHQKQAAHVIGGSAVLNVLLNALLIPIWGLQGAAIATATATIAWNVVLARYVHLRLGLRASAI